MKSFILSISIVALLLSGCGGGGGGGSSSSETGSDNSSSSDNTTTSTGIFVDAPVAGLEYSSPSHSGKTDNNGYFNYTSGESVTFKIGQITLGSLIVNSSNSVVTPVSVIPNSNINDTRVVEVLRLLQSLDSDHNPANGIKITTIPNTTAINLAQNHTALNDTQLASLIGVNTARLTSVADAKSHFNSTLSSLNQTKAEVSRINTVSHSESDNDSHSSSESDNNSHSDSNNGGTVVTGASGYTLLAWNDLGMHCFDGSDFSIFSILPPYNNLDAQLINNAGTTNKHVTTGVTLTYKSLNYNGHINTVSSTKTNFWDYLASLFPGKTSVNDTGLTGNKTPSITPHAMTYNATHNWFEATAIPLINRDDNNATNYYPMVTVIAKNTAGTILATADVVLPVSDEMDCAKCHASTVTSNAAKPTAGWENNTDVLKDYKLNILKLHDEIVGAINTADLTALKTKGYNYNSSLYNTAKSGTPILCAACHSSTALNTTSIGSAKSLTASLHLRHSGVIDPSNGQTLNSSSNRNSCYNCHPGATTECLRGAMGSAKKADGTSMMQCQSCHGTMNDVGSINRTGWMDEPNCQACHQNANRYTSALVNGSLRAVLDTRFATNPNTPSTGVSLYRFSTGHGSLQCSSCHGSTHAIFPSSHAEDNVISNHIQGHSGTIAECTSCHTTVPNTTTGGPHGMHTAGQSWVSTHQNVAKNGGAAACTTCHGSDYRGSVLSETFTARTLSGKAYAKGQIVSCYDCHGKKW